MSEELKPCPFCGKTQHETDGTDMFNWISCKCDVVGPGGYHTEDAIRAWNTRPIEDTLRARIAELEGALSDAYGLIDDWCKHTGSSEWSEYATGRAVRDKFWKTLAKPPQSGSAAPCT